MKKVSDKLRNMLLADAEDQPNLEYYIGEYGYPEFFDEISDDVDEIVKYLTEIHDIVHKPFRDILRDYGLTQKQFCQKFYIPRRTVENWSMNTRSCPVYVRMMILTLLKEKKNT